MEHPIAHTMVLAIVWLQLDVPIFKTRLHGSLGDTEVLRYI